MRLGTRSLTVARDEWNLGVVPQSIQDIAHRGIVAPVHWLKPDSWRILADPFCYQRPDGRFIVLAERLNHWVGRGEIWQAVLPLDGKLDISHFHPYAKSRVHLSYPYRAIIDGAAYFIMESHEADGLHLWRDEGGKISYVSCLLHGPAVDATLYCDGRGLWLFCTFANDGPDEKLFLYHSSSLSGPWLPHAKNPVKVDIAGARPGGQLFQCQFGRLIRPAQDCSKTYGGALQLNHVLRLTADEFEEVPLLKVNPADPYYCDGLHTIACAGNFTLIDGKRWHTRRAENVARRLAAGVRRLRRRASSNCFGPDWRFIAGPG